MIRTADGPRAIIDWQRRLAARQTVYCVVVGHVCGEHTGNMYDSREAAQLEADWLLEHGAKYARVSSIGKLHDFQLSKERWT